MRVVVLNNHSAQPPHLLVVPGNLEKLHHDVGVPELILQLLLRIQPSQFAPGTNVEKAVVIDVTVDSRII